MNVADECRAMGIRVGDTIIGREIYSRGSWHEARLTLLWLGQQAAMWSAQERADSDPEWSEPCEDSAWVLTDRKWRKDNPAATAAPKPEPCPRGDNRPEPSCTNRAQCWEPCGELGKSAEHARVGKESADYLRAYRDALDHAAFYVRDHCQSGEHHAEVIRELVRPLPNQPKRETTVGELKQLRFLAEEAAKECDVESDWFDATLIESDTPITSTRKARRFIAAMTPQTAIRLILLADRFTSRVAAWQPIETAPQDDTPVDLWLARGERAVNMRRVVIAQGNAFYDPVLAGPCCVRDATHWMPLPPAPKGEK